MFAGVIETGAVVLDLLSVCVCVCVRVSFVCRVCVLFLLGSPRIQGSEHA